MKKVFLDTETTGLAPGQIAQLSMIIEEDNKKRKYVLHIREDKSLDIELLDYDKKYLGSINTIMARNKDDESIKCIYIEDVRVSHINQGDGTLLLQRLIKYCEENYIDFIYGNLSKFDYEDHQERLVHFYVKNGFEVIIFPKISNNGIDVGQIKYNVKGGDNNEKAYSRKDKNV